MAKQLNVNLGFTADTSQAKRQLQELQNQLTNLTTNPMSIGGNFTKEIQQASGAIAELKVHLEQATNVDTGTLDFSKLNQSLSQGEKSLADYGEVLKSLGPEGQKAFMSLAESVAMSEVPIKRSNALLTEMWTTLKNTARWQISSSILHGFMGALQSAYGYAQDLNASLTDIRIVTGQSVDQMAAFAERANKAAKSLSATTTEYTKASLIYYQQGLSDSEVQTRTDTTIKMANVTGQSAQIVSDQMTAIWNNFDDGSKSLEYYADVLTALGAATASSTDEIAQGLEKFASVADTVGLSYEYATAALATVTAETRQSADVVGTAFKTLFARIQDLELGETLDDGTTLGSYSQSLAKVGINIKDTSGELKDMDVILEEMAQKWTTLGDAEQVALAQSVAGVRQYTQLIALMDNWEVMEENLNTAKNSTGAVDEQQKAFEEGWEGAQKRVQAALEGIYQTLIDDDAFISLLNSLEKVITYFDRLIDTMGGLKGVLPAIGALMTKIFAPQLSKSLQDMSYNLKMMTASGREAIQQEKKNTIDEFSSMMADDTISGVSGQTSKAIYQDQLRLQSELIDKSESMTEIEQKRTQILMDQLKVYGQQAIEASKIVEAKQKEQQDASFKLRTNAVKNAEKQGKEYNQSEVTGSIQNIKVAAEGQAKVAKGLQKIQQEGKASTSTIREMGKAIYDLSKQDPDLLLEDDQAELNKLLYMLQSKVPGEAEEAAAKIQAIMDRTLDAAKMSGEATGLGNTEDIDAYVTSVQETVRAQDGLDESNKRVQDSSKGVENSINTAKGVQQSWSDQIVECANTVMSFTAALNSLGGMWNTLKDPDISGWEKFISVFSTLAMVIPMVVNVFKGIKSVIDKDTIATGLNTIAKWLNALASKGQADSADKAEKEIKEETEATNKNTVATTANAAVKKTIGKDGKTYYSQGGKRISKEAGEKLLKEGGEEIVEEGAEKVAGKGLKGALKNIGGSLKNVGGGLKAVGKAALNLGKSFGVTFAFVAAGAAMVAGAIKIWNKDAEAAKEAAEAAERATQRAEEARQEYDNFKSTLDGYKSAKDGLDSLTQGTAEFRQGVLDANAEAMKLIDTVEGLEYSVNKETGLIEIDEASLEKAQQEKLTAMSNAQNTSLLMNQKAKDAQTKADLTNFNRDVVKTDGGNWNADNGAAVLGAAGAGAATGAIIGTVIPGIGNAVGAAVGGAIGLLAGAVTGLVGTIAANKDQTQYEQDAMSALADYYSENGDAALTEEGIKEALGDAGLEVDQGFIDSILANKDATRELIAEMAANTAANEALNLQLASNALANNEDVQNSEHADDIVEITASQMDEEREAAKAKLEEEGWGTDGISKATGVNDEAEKVFEEYAKAAGLNVDELELTDTKGSDKNREFVYKDAEGKEQTVSLEDMKEVMATSMATEATNTKGTELAAIFDKLTDDQVGAAKAAMTGEVDSLTMGQVQNGIDASSFNLTQAELEQMGYANLEEYQTALNEMVAQGQAAMEDVTLTGLDPKLVEGMSLETAQAIQDTMNEINLGPLGEEGGKAYAEGLNKMVGELDVEDQQAALQQLNNIDWSSWDAMEQADQIMKEFGVDIDTSSQEWEQFAEKMRIANNSLPDFSKMKEDLITVSSVVSKLDVGSIISDEDYNKLMAYNDEWDRFFVLQADGTRKFIGDKDAMLKATREDIMAQKEELELSKERIDAIKESGVDWKISAKSIDQQYGDGKDGQLSQDTVDAYNEENGTDYTDSDDMINNLMADQTQEMIDGSAEMKAMLNDSGYDDATIEAILQEARDGNRERLDAMLGAVDTYMGQDLETANKELDEMLASTATSIEELNQMVAQGNITDPEAYTKQVSVLAQSATSLEELHRVNDLSGGTLSAYEYGEALTTLAANFENCAKETEEYEKALLSGDAATIQAAQSALEASIEAGELAAKYDLNAEELEDYGKRLQTLNKDQKLSASEANRLAAANMRLDRGVGNLNDNLKNYKKALKDSNKGSAEWSKALSDLKTDLSDIVNVADGDMLSDTFAEATLESEDLQKALDGDEAAILRLRLAAADDIIANLDIEGDENIKTVSDNWEYLKANMAEGISTPGVDQTELINSFNEMIAAGNMTKEEIEAALSGLNVSANVKTEYVPQTVTVPQTITEEAMLPNGTATVQVPGENGEWTSQTVTLQKKITRTYESAPVEVQGVVPKYTIEGTTGEGGVTTGFVQAPAPKVSKSQTSSGKGGGGGGGGSKKKTSESRKKKNDMVDRYKEINDQLEKTSRQMNKTSIAADGLWGAKRFNMLKKNIDLMKQEHKQLEKKYDLAKKYLKEDKNALVKAGTSKEAKKNLGMSVNFKFDESGAITNYTEQMTALYKKREALLNSFGSEMDEKETERLEKFDKSFDELKEAYEQYETTLDEKQDLEEEAAQKKLETQEAYLNLLNEELELKVAINDADLEVLDYYLSKIEGDLYAAAEGMKYMGEQAMLYEDNLVDQYDQYDKLNKAYQDGEINMAQYKESMKELQSATISNLQSLQESKTAMQDYYGNVLSMAQEELASFTDQMSQLNSVMDHYTSLLDMLGKTKDFEARDKILTSKANNIRNELDVYTEEYRMYSEEAEKWEAKMLEAEVGSNEYETYKKNWDAAREAANEAQENMLTKTEEWAEAMRAIVENNLSGLAADLEASLTGGSNFDTILNSMDRANSLQEEYLTTTNKIYETNKLMRTAQQEIDKTSNEVAKRKMKDFIAETKQLQNQGQLSKYELEIQQAKYDLLLAEIALEEAQNAKSTVRLQRDSEGNFGYVYTADSSKTAEAEQKFADAQNKLYNIGLEGANNYNQKYAEAMSEMYNELTELQQKYLEGQFASEDEYQKAVEATKEYHYNKLKQFSSLYQTALTTDSRVIADAWSTDFNKMIYKTDEWKDSIDNYTQQAASELAVWASTVSTVMSESGLDNVNNELEKMTADSEALKEVLLGDDGLIAAVEEEVEQVGALSEAYIEVQNAIDDVIKSYEDFLGLVNTKFTGSNSIGATTITLPTVQGFDTGGYTGEWGSWGKLAMLHEKEMILNQQDTANLLKTMEFLDNIINAIDLQATNAALGGLLSSPTLGNMNNHETLEQSVKIEASFPNVSSRFEIEEAFETLINRASQYANRK